MQRKDKGYVSSFITVLILLLCGRYAVSLYTANQRLYSDGGKELVLKGIHVFGLNTVDTAPGLNPWMADPNIPVESSILNWRTIVWKMSELGFNAVRLPFNFWFLSYPLVDYKRPCVVTSDADLIASITPPGRDVSGRSVSRPPPAIPDGICNSDMPSSSYFERLVWTICTMTEAGLYVVIDHHLDNLKFDETMAEATTNTQKFVDNYVQLIQTVVSRGCARDKFIVNFLNEPDGYGIRWQNIKTTKPALESLYRSLLEATVPACPRCLFFLDGTHQFNFPVLANWGDGYATRKEVFKYADKFWDDMGSDDKMLTSPAAFFDWLISQDNILSQVVLSPHVYCPNVTTAPDRFIGQELWRRLTDSFGYLSYEGYCASSGKCYRFPIVIGETGTNFGTSNETQCFTSIAQYMFNQDGAANGYLVEDWVKKAYDKDDIPPYSGKHDTISNWFWWVWNPESRDTGGLVKDDHKTIDWFKIDALSGDNNDMKPGFGLLPWYKGGAAAYTPPPLAEWNQATSAKDVPPPPSSPSPSPYIPASPSPSPPAEVPPSPSPSPWPPAPSPWPVSDPNLGVGTALSPSPSPMPSPSPA